MTRTRHTVGVRHALRFVLSLSFLLSLQFTITTAVERRGEIDSTDIDQMIDGEYSNMRSYNTLRGSNGDRKLLSNYHNAKDSAVLDVGGIRKESKSEPMVIGPKVEHKKHKKKRNEEHHRKYREKMARLKAEKEAAEKAAEANGAPLGVQDGGDGVRGGVDALADSNADESSSSLTTTSTDEATAGVSEKDPEGKLGLNSKPIAGGNNPSSSLTSLDDALGSSDTKKTSLADIDTPSTPASDKDESMTLSDAAGSSKDAATTSSSPLATLSTKPGATTPNAVPESEASKAVGHDGHDTSADSGLFDKAGSTTSGRGPLAKGKKAALFQVHFEGNLGDQMETIPLLQRLFEWGVQIDCYLSMWQDPAKRLDPKVKDRVAKYVTNFYVDGVPQDHVLRERMYDVVIITPGPTVNELTHCVGKVHMAWFGVSVTNWAVDTYVKHKPCLKLVAVREEVSYDKSARMLDPHFDDVRLMLSGDLSFSYSAIEEDVNSHKKKFQDQLGTLLDKKWTLIFSRENNFGPQKGITIENNVVKVTKIDGTKLDVPGEEVVFASSSNLEDNSHMSMMRTQYKFQRNRLIIFDSIEEMWALVSLAGMVVTDRYHPGIAALIVGTPLTLTSYPNENVKMKGLGRMQQYKREDVRNMNEKAFERLLQVIHRPKVKEGPITTSL